MNRLGLCAGNPMYRTIENTELFKYIFKLFKYTNTLALCH